MRRRHGFTLIELLVSMVLIIFIMLILSEAFAKALDAFTRLKAIGEMDARLRQTVSVFRRDLAADHFEGRRRLSDADYWNEGPPREGFFRVWHGSGRATAAGAPYFVDAVDADALSSSRAVNHMLHFSVKLRGNELKDFFSARLPGGSPLPALGIPESRYQETANDYHAQWAEVVYFLRPNGARAAGTTPLYNLHRIQLLLVPDNRLINWGPAASRVPISGTLTPLLPNALDKDYLEVSCKPSLAIRPGTGSPGLPTSTAGYLYFNNATDVTMPPRRFGMDPSNPAGLPIASLGTGAAGATGYTRPAAVALWTYPTLGELNPELAGTDVILTDVISMLIQVSRPGNWNFEDLARGVNPQFTSGGRDIRVFDTWTSARDDTFNYSNWRPSTAATPSPAHSAITVPWPTAGDAIRLGSIRVTLRVWDVKTQQTRQVSIIQDL